MSYIAREKFVTQDKAYKRRTTTKPVSRFPTRLDRQPLESWHFGFRKKRGFTICVASSKIECKNQLHGLSIPFSSNMPNTALLMTHSIQSLKRWCLFEEIVHVYNSIYRYIELSAFSYSLETTGDM